MYSPCILGTPGSNILVYLQVQYDYYCSILLVGWFNFLNPEQKETKVNRINKFSKTKSETTGCKGKRM